MNYQPKDSSLKKHIDHYWIVEDAEALFSKSTLVYDYPGITPELILPLEGTYACVYMEKKIPGKESYAL